MEGIRFGRRVQRALRARQVFAAADERRMPNRIGCRPTRPTPSRTVAWATEANNVRDSTSAPVQAGMTPFLRALSIRRADSGRRAYHASRRRAWRMHVTDRDAAPAVGSGIRPRRVGRGETRGGRTRGRPGRRGGIAGQRHDHRRERQSGQSCSRDRAPRGCGDGHDPRALPSGVAAGGSAVVGDGWPSSLRREYLSQLSEIFQSARIATTGSMPSARLRQVARDERHEEQQVRELHGKAVHHDRSARGRPRGSGRSCGAVCGMTAARSQGQVAVCRRGATIDNPTAAVSANAAPKRKAVWDPLRSHSRPKITDAGSAPTPIAR
jgi:hypothetical protein